MASNLSFFELVELKGRNGGHRDLKFKLSLWLARRVLTSIANDPQLRKELAAIIRVEKKYER